MSKIVLTIGGSDTWGGGGIQTDLKTMEHMGVFGVTALTCIAVETPETPFMIQPLPIELLQQQLQTIAHTYQLSAIKIGLLATSEAVEAVMAFIKEQTCPIVLDPVLAFKETDEQYDAVYVEQLRKLAQYATIITPNVTEAMLLTEATQPHSLDALIQLSRRCYQRLGVPTIVKGGARIPLDMAHDVLYDDKGSLIFALDYVERSTVNGAGCSFASSIASQLALGEDLLAAIDMAKQFVQYSIENGIALADGTGNVWGGRRS